MEGQDSRSPVSGRKASITKILSLQFLMTALSFDVFQPDGMPVSGSPFAFAVRVQPQASSVTERGKESRDSSSASPIFQGEKFSYSDTYHVGQSAIQSCSERGGQKKLAMHNVDGARTDFIGRAGGALMTEPVLDIAGGHALVTSEATPAALPSFRTKAPLVDGDRPLDWFTERFGGLWRSALLDVGAKTRSQGRSSLVVKWGPIAAPDSLAALKSAISGELAAAHREAVEQLYGALKMKELPPRSGPASKFMNRMKSIFSDKAQGLPKDPVGRVVTSFFPLGGSKIARIIKHSRLYNRVSKMFPNTCAEESEKSVEKNAEHLVCDQQLFPDPEPQIQDEDANNDDERRAGLLFAYGSLVDYAREQGDQFSQGYVDVLGANANMVRKHESTHAQIQHRIELMEELYRLTIEPSADVGMYFLKNSPSQRSLEKEHKGKYLLDSMKTLWRESERQMLPGPYEPEEEISPGPAGGGDNMPRINFAYKQDVERYSEHLAPVLFRPEYDFMLSYTQNKRDPDLTRDENRDLAFLTRKDDEHVEAMRERADRPNLYAGEEDFDEEQDDPDKPTSFYELTTDWLFDPSEKSLGIFLHKYGCAIRVQRMLRPSWTEAEREKHVQAFASKLRESYPANTPPPDAISITMSEDGKKNAEDPISRYRKDAKQLFDEHNEDASRDEIIAYLGDRFKSLLCTVVGEAGCAAWAQDYLTGLESREKLRDWLLSAFLPEPRRLRTAARPPGSSFHGFLRGGKRDQMRDEMNQWLSDAPASMFPSSRTGSRGSRQVPPGRGLTFLTALRQLDVLHNAQSRNDRTADELRGELEVRTNVNAWQKSHFYLEERFVPGTAEWEQEEKTKLPSIVDAMFQEVEKRKNFVQFVMASRSHMGLDNKFLQVPAPRQDEKDIRHGAARYFVRVLLLPLLEQVLQERLFRLELRKKILFETALQVLLNGTKRAVKTKKLKNL